MENLEELVYLSIQEMIQPLDQLGPESPTAQFFPHSPPQSPPRVMVVAINKTTWMEITPVAPLHDFPKNPE